MSNPAPNSKRSALSCFAAGAVALTLLVAIPVFALSIEGFRGRFADAPDVNESLGWYFLVMGMVICLPATLITLVALYFHRTDQRIDPGRCQNCGYDLRGSRHSMVCPECGKSIDGAH